MPRCFEKIKINLAAQSNHTVCAGEGVALGDNAIGVGSFHLVIITVVCLEVGSTQRYFVSHFIADAATYAVAVDDE